MQENETRDDVLSDTAKLATNRYIRGVLLPSGIAATGVAFLLGFFVNEVARSNGTAGLGQHFGGT